MKGGRGCSVLHRSTSWTWFAYFNIKLTSWLLSVYLQGVVIYFSTIIWLYRSQTWARQRQTDKDTIHFSSIIRLYRSQPWGRLQQTNKRTILLSWPPFRPGHVILHNSQKLRAFPRLSQRTQCSFADTANQEYLRVSQPRNGRTYDCILLFILLID